MFDEIKTVLSFVTAPMMAIIAYFGWTLRATNAKMDKTMSEQQIRQLITDKLDVLKVQNQSFSARLMTLEAKIDRLIDLSFNK